MDCHAFPAFKFPLYQLGGLKDKIRYQMGKEKGEKHTKMNITGLPTRMKKDKAIVVLEYWS